MSDLTDLDDYIKEHYGRCTRGADCYWERDGLGEGCLRRGWRGQLCKHWQPTTAGTWEALRAAMKALYAGEP